jgi:hypothetical protein
MESESGAQPAQSPTEPSNVQQSAITNAVTRRSDSSNASPGSERIVTSRESSDVIIGASTDETRRLDTME